MMINRTSLIVILLVAIVGIELCQGLRCYQHDTCFGGCPTLDSSIVQCASDQTKCWKFRSPLGTKRGCADDRCSLQVDAAMVGTASVCCSGNLCNAAVRTMHGSTMVIVGLIAFVFAGFL